MRDHKKSPINAKQKSKRLTEDSIKRDEYNSQPSPDSHKLSERFGEENSQKRFGSQKFKYRQRETPIKQSFGHYLVIIGGIIGCILGLYLIFSMLSGSSSGESPKYVTFSFKMPSEQVSEVHDRKEYTPDQGNNGNNPKRPDNTQKKPEKNVVPHENVPDPNVEPEKVEENANKDKNEGELFSLFIVDEKNQPGRKLDVQILEQKEIYRLKFSEPVSFKERGEYINIIFTKPTGKCYLGLQIRPVVSIYELNPGHGAYAVIEDKVTAFAQQGGLIDGEWVNVYTEEQVEIVDCAHIHLGLIGSELREVSIIPSSRSYTLDKPLEFRPLSGTNLMVNPGFEDNTRIEWKIGEQIQSSFASEHKHGGKSSLKLISLSDRWNQYALVYPKFEPKQGKLYRFSLWALGSPGSFFDVVFFTNLEIDKNDMNKLQGVFMEESTNEGHQNNKLAWMSSIFKYKVHMRYPLENAWRMYTTCFRIPDNAYDICGDSSIAIGIDKGSVYLDDFHMEEIDTPLNTSKWWTLSNLELQEDKRTPQINNRTINEELSPLKNLLIETVVNYEKDKKNPETLEKVDRNVSKILELMVSKKHLFTNNKLWLSYMMLMNTLSPAHPFLKEWRKENSKIIKPVNLEQLVKNLEGHKNQGEELSQKDGDKKDGKLRKDEYKPIRTTELSKDVIEKMDKVNTAFGHTLFNQNLLWNEHPGAVAGRFELSPDSSQYMTWKSTPNQDITILGVKVSNMKVIGTQEGVNEISIIFIDRRSSAESMTRESEFNDKLRQESIEIRKKLDNLLGGYREVQIPAVDRKEPVSLWNLHNHSFILNARRGESLTLKILPTNKINISGGPAGTRLSIQALSKRLRENVSYDKAFGDVLIQNIPIMDRDEGSTSMPTYYEQMIKYYGGDVEDIGKEVEFKERSMNAVILGGKKIAEKLGMSFKTFIPKKGQVVSEIKTHIDQGIPIICILIFDRDLAKSVSSRLSKRKQLAYNEYMKFLKTEETESTKIRLDLTKGNISLIAGYNLKTKEIAVFDRGGAYIWFTEQEVYYFSNKQNFIYFWFK